MAIDETTEEIRRRADIVDVVGSHVALRPAGNDRWKACCPFHDEKSPSFYVSREKGFYKCFGCGVSGDIFKFLQQVENLSFPEAKKQLADRYGVAIPKFGKELTPEQQAQYDERDRLMKITAAATAFFREQFAGNKGLEARDYARRRGLSGHTLDKFGIGYAPDAWDGLQHHLINKYGFKAEDAALAGLLIEKEDERNGQAYKRHYDRYRHRLMFPIWDAQGRVVAFGGRAMEGGETGTPDAKYINSPEGPLFSKSRTLYGWHIARPEVAKKRDVGEGVIITEGYMDAIALHEAGFAQTIATLGTALTAQHVAALARLNPRTVYLCYDGDSAGMRAALRSTPLFAQHDLTVRVVALPSEDDPDTFVRKHGEIGFLTLLRNARLLARYRVEMAIGGFDLGQVTERMEAMRAAADVIAEVENDIEKDDYIAWLSEKWGQSEGVTQPARLQMISAAVRREVGQAVKRRRDAARMSTHAGNNRSASANNANANNASGNLGGDQNASVGGADAKAASQNNANASNANGSNADFVSNATGNGNASANRVGNGNGFGWANGAQSWAQRQAARDAENEDVNQTLADSGSEKLSGVSKAERILLSSLLGNPSGRSRILDELPPAKWTQEVHQEIVSALRQVDWNEPVDPSVLMQTLSVEAGGLIGELMMNDEAQIVANADVIQDCIARIEGHWARQIEHEVLELIRLKLERGETISEDDRLALNAALRATRRKQPPPP